MFRHLSVVVALSLCVLVGCGKKTTSIETPDGQRVTVDQDGNQATMTITDDKGGQSSVATGTGVSLPKDFPSDIPIYSGATPMASVNTPQGKQVTLTVSADTATVVAFYTKQLVEKGWKVEGSINVLKGAMITASKDSRQLAVSIGSNDSNTVLTLILTKK